MAIYFYFCNILPCFTIQYLSLNLMSFKTIQCPDPCQGLCYPHSATNKNKTKYLSSIEAGHEFINKIF